MRARMITPSPPGNPASLATRVAPSTLASAPGYAGIRIDTGFRAGDAVTPYYDALLAKLIVWGADRPQALARLVEALDAFGIEGVTTNLAFLRALLRHPQVVRNEIDIGFIERELAALTRSAPSLAALALANFGFEGH